MRSLALIVALASLTAGVAPSFAAQSPSSDPDLRGCTVVRIARDGTRTVTPPSGGPPSQGASASSHVESHGPASSRSSVSVSASSHGRSTASASASSQAGDRRQTITRTEDERGCTVTIDER
jgi:hypothetical protein